MTERHRRGAVLIAAVAALLAAGTPAAYAQGAAGGQQAQGPSSGPKTPLPAPTARAPQPNQSRLTPVGDWPCIQPKVAQLSYGQVWSGPPLEQAFETWRDDGEVADAVTLLVARRTSKEEASAAIDRLAKAAGPDKNAKLTELFAGVFQEINASRSAVITGIERYARKQRTLSERIKEASLKIAADGRDMATQNSPEYRQKEENLNWDTRIYDERAQALNYVCESPVILDQLAFDRAREIQSRLD